MNDDYIGWYRIDSSIIMWHVYTRNDYSNIIALYHTRHVKLVVMLTQPVHSSWPQHIQGQATIVLILSKPHVNLH